MFDLETIQFRNEAQARRNKARRFFAGGQKVTVPKEIKDEIIDDIFEIVAFSDNKKKARKQLRKLLELWIDG